MKQVCFTVYELPAPQGSKRHVGNGRMIESSTKVKPWRQAVIAAAKDCGVTFTGAVEVEAYFTLPKPKSAPKRRESFPDRKPDGDKLTRATWDALVIAGVIEDDARIVRWSGGKYYPQNGKWALPSSGAVIIITQVGS